MAYLNFIVTSLTIRIIIRRLCFNFIMGQVSLPLSFPAKQFHNENRIVPQCLL